MKSDVHQNANTDFYSKLYRLIGMTAWSEKNTDWHLIRMRKADIKTH